MVLIIRRGVYLAIFVRFTFPAIKPNRKLFSQGGMWFQEVSSAVMTYVDPPTERERPILLRVRYALGWCEGG